MSNSNYYVKNRSAGVIFYEVPDLGVRRTFQPGEIKSIPYNELLQLSYQSGGRILMEEYLMIGKEVLKQLEMRVEPEYDLDGPSIIELMKNGSIDQWIDCLNFAPAGVIDLIKKLSVELPLENYEKKKALKDIYGFDVDIAFKNSLDDNNEKPTNNKPVRRI